MAVVSALNMEGALPLTQAVTRVATVTRIDKDRLGNDVTVEVESPDPVKVFSWWIVSSDEPVLAGHERLIVDARMIAAVGEFSPTDKVELPGYTDGAGVPVRFAVMGWPENVDHNPWLHVGREMVNLKEVSG